MAGWRINFGLGRKIVSVVYGTPCPMQCWMSAFPDWATPGENRKLFGIARALGADDLTLSDRDATLGYVEQKSSGNVIVHYFPQETCETFIYLLIYINFSSFL